MRPGGGGSWVEDGENLRVVAESTTWNWRLRLVSSDHRRNDEASLFMRGRVEFRAWKRNERNEGAAVWRLPSWQSS